MNIQTKSFVSFVMTENNLVLTIGQDIYSVGKDHLNYDKILDKIYQGDFENINQYVDARKEIIESGKIKIDEHGAVTFNGHPLQGPIADKFNQLVIMKRDISPLAKFMENLDKNPSERSKKELYGFLINKGFPLTEDGCFIAYKAIRDDWRDIHSGTFDNRVGAVHEMPRSNVDIDSNNACSTGFHVGTFEYAQYFGGNGSRMVLCKVNPTDAVAVPADHNQQKLRVCRYQVMDICSSRIEDPYWSSL